MPTEFKLIKGQKHRFRGFIAGVSDQNVSIWDGNPVKCSQTCSALFLYEKDFRKKSRKIEQ